MSSSVRSPPHRIALEPLTPAAFAPFGHVIENPTKTGHPDPSPLQSQAANQGTAVKWLDVSQTPNFYTLAPSKKPARISMNMFVCSPRRLRTSPSTTLDSGAAGPSDSKQLFDVTILERHPYTSQTFIPLSLKPSESSTSYIVIVAPTLPSNQRHASIVRPKPYPVAPPKPKRSLASLFSRARPSPFDNSSEPPPTELAPPLSSSYTRTNEKPKGRGPPDLENMRAFLARGDQAVTYGAGTWHAPMVVIGAENIDFITVQFANGVPEEDCQEKMLERVKGETEGAVVEVDAKILEGNMERSLKAKL